MSMGFEIGTPHYRGQERSERKLRRRYLQGWALGLLLGAISLTLNRYTDTATAAMLVATFLLTSIKESSPVITSDHEKNAGQFEFRHKCSEQRQRGVRHALAVSFLVAMTIKFWPILHGS